MSGFDNGTLQSGIAAQTKQFGSILRGLGPPSPSAGVIGDLYVDTQTFFLYERRSNNKTDPWGNYLFLIPPTYQTLLRWFSPSQPLNSVGANGDYCLMWAGYSNYGMQPSILGPKAVGVWPTNPAAVAVDINPLYSAENEHTV